MVTRFELCERNESVIVVTRTADLMTFLRAIPCPVRKFAAKQEIPDGEALKVDLEQKAKEFKETGAEVYAKV